MTAYGHASSPPLVPRAAAITDAVEQAEKMADEHLAREEEVRRVGAVVRWMDDLVRVPGTKFGVGLDALLGFAFPGLGDAVTGAVALSLLVTALRRGVPKVVVARMLMNIGIDVLGGLIPGVGDLFDVLWRANVRNLELIERHQGELEPRARASDWLWVAAGAMLVAGSVAAPIAITWWLLAVLVG